MSAALKKPFAHTAGSAAVEMALVTPLLLTLMFGSFELGNYFMDNHVVAKAVRDGARFAARQNFSNYSCTSASIGNVLTGTVADNIRNVVRTGSVSGGNPRLYGWTDPNTIVVTYDCVSLSSVSPSYGGIYGNIGYAPVVRVKISDGNPKLAYHSLFNSLGFSSASLYLNAQSQASVTGV